MAQGKKYNDDIKEKAFALLATNNSFAEVARQLNIPRTTIKSWYQNKKDDKDFVRLRLKKKESFVNEAWELIDDSLAVVKKRIGRARYLEDNIDLVAEAIRKNAKAIETETGIGWFALLDVIKELNSLKSPKVSEISTLIGTIYDKQALANNEATERSECKVTIEDYLKDCKGAKY